MRNSRFGAGLILLAGSLCAAVHPRIELPADSPVGVLSFDPAQSSETTRGGALLLDLHAALSLRNFSQRRIRGITMVVSAQDVTPGGKGSVTMTSLDVGPGETFPLRIDLRLMRPVQGGSNVPVVVSLDGVLFDDLQFFGPNALNSRRTLTMYEWEARRDRQYYKTVLASRGEDGLRREVIASMARQQQRPNVDVQMVRGGRATNVEPEKQVQFAFLEMPDAPVQPLEGMARVSGNEARAPRMEVRNRSDRAVKYLEMGWILQDQGGREFLAGSLPSDLKLLPGQKVEVLSDTALKFPQRGGQPLAIEKMSAFVSNVEFSDGSVWVPNRSDLANPRLQRVLGLPAEEQRLVQLYRSKGIQALVDELKKF